MPRRRIPLRTAVFALLSAAPWACAQFTLDREAAELAFTSGLVVDGVGSLSRRPINTEALIASLADGSLQPAAVKAGDILAPGHAWEEIAADAGNFGSARQGRYILVRVQSPVQRVMVLEAAGHSMVYVNGEPRMGDPYRLGYCTLPVLLREGENSFLFAHAGRGPMSAALRKPSAEVILLEKDLTLPDLVAGSESEVLLGVPVIHAAATARTIEIYCDANGIESVSGPFLLQPCSIVNVPVAVKCGPVAGEDALVVRVRAVEGGLERARSEVTLRVAPPDSTHKRTFTSRIDGSTQYVSIVPPADGGAAPALVLSLHGAGVEATGQAGSYAAKPGIVIACPTNRRPFGFDWEDWGRIDALEAMEHVSAWYATNPARQYLTGHSMGGHGTWNIGVLCPDRFAAIAPSAGWLSFDSYTARGGPPYAPDTALGKVFQDARASSMTLDYFANLRGKGVFILHGEADDNVPVAQARSARDALQALGIPHGYHEQPGAGHWWDDDGPGAACLDWPAIWETFANAEPLEPGAPRAVEVPLDGRGFVNGSFKRIFDREFALVYSTGGSEEENAWSFAKARYDSEQWWYRGNGHAPVLSDAEFLSSERGRNVILYGNAQTNRAWSSTLGSDTLRMRRGELSVAGKAFTGNDLGCLAVVPRQDEDGMLVGVIGGTGLAGMRATERLSYFSSGVGFPEVVVMRAGVWKTGFDGVEGAGPIGAIVWK